MYTAICVQPEYRAGATAAQAQTHLYRRTRNSTLKNLKHEALKLYTYIEGAFFDIDISLISWHYDIEVLDLDFDVSSISYCFDIEGCKLQPSISTFFRIQAFNIEGLNLRYRLGIVISYLMSKVIFGTSLSKVAPSISGYKDIKGPRSARFRMIWQYTVVGTLCRQITT